MLSMPIDNEIERQLEALGDAAILRPGRDPGNRLSALGEHGMRR